MKTLVLAEKPSVARDLAAVLGATARREASLEGQGYVVTWAIGHLVGLAEPQEMDPNWRAWRMDRLPMLPREWPLTVLEQTAPHFAQVKRLLLDPTLTRVVCATDAGREGELIFRYLYRAAGCRLPVERLWVSSLTPQAIAEGFRRLKPSREYDRLADAAEGRSRADWLVGMNLSRAYTVRFGPDLLSVGRVQTPTLAMLVQRERAIREFVPEQYCEVEATFGQGADGYAARWFRQPLPPGQEPRLAQRLPPDAKEADAIAQRCAHRDGEVVSAQGQDKAQPAPLLFDLTELQRVANRLWGLTAKQTLEVAQTLYEKHKLLTYPRTDSRHLSQAVAAELPQVVHALRPAYAGLLAPGTGERPLSRRFVDDAKVSDHHAIIPTPLPRGHKALSRDEERLYDLVCRRLLMAWHDDLRTRVTTVVTRVRSPAAEDFFRASGTVVTQKGWKVIDVDSGRKKGDEATLPDGLQAGQVRKVEGLKVLQLETEPPRRLTDATLLTAMETAGKELDSRELEEAMRERGLGTPATRAATLETLLTRGYAERQGKSLVATERGIALIDVVHEAVKSPALTGEWELALKELEKGRGTLGEFMTRIERFVVEVVGQVGGAPAAMRPLPAHPSDLGGRGPTGGAGVNAAPPTARPDSRRDTGNASGLGFSGASQPTTVDARHDAGARGASGRVASTGASQPTSSDARHDAGSRGASGRVASTGASQPTTVDARHDAGARSASGRVASSGASQATTFDARHDAGSRGATSAVASTGASQLTTSDARHDAGSRGASTGVASSGASQPANSDTRPGTNSTNAPTRRPVQGSLHHVLSTRFGHADFRPFQEEVCQAVTDGADALLVMPTGSGKSLCYQLPGVARGGTTLVISPLIALMEDQTLKLQALGFTAERIHSGRSREESRAVCRAYLDGQLDFLTIAPERLSVPGFVELLARRPPTLIAVDEAHCISHWGHDFRPDYRLLGARLPLLRPAPVLALTATATQRVQDDILTQLGVGGARRFIRGFRRENLALEAMDCPRGDRVDELIRTLDAPGRLPAIVYVPSRKQAEEVAETLSRYHRAAPYHAGLDPQERARAQEAFLAGRLDVVVATIAFGMGIDKADIRTVVHLALPGSLEGYYQEIGRAGRDGKPARALLLYGWGDRKVHESFLERDYPPTRQLQRLLDDVPAKGIDREVLLAETRLSNDVAEPALDKLWIHGGVAIDGDDVVRPGKDGWQRPYEAMRAHREAQLAEVMDFAQSTDCRMTRLVRHFGDTRDGRPCGHCDACRPHESLGRTFRAPNAQERNAARHVVEELEGFDDVSTGTLYRKVFPGEEVDRREFDRLLAALVRTKVLALRDDEFEKDGKTIRFRRARLEPGGRKALDGAQFVVETMPEPKTKAGKGRKGKAATHSRSSAKADGPKGDAGTVDRLREWRRGVSKAMGVPAFRVMTDKTMHAMASAAPKSLQGLMGINGVGPKFIERHGAQVLALLR